MNEKITVITPTGDREIAFGLCKKWMNHQTVSPYQWIIVDDGIKMMSPEGLPPFSYYLRRHPMPNDPKHTLTINMNSALPFIQGEKILIMEDDEYYAPEYIAEMVKRLDSYTVVGIGDAKYYHIITGGYNNYKNMGHASLAETGFCKSFLPVFTECVKKGMDIYWLDDQLWKKVRESKKTAASISSTIFVDSENSLYVGIKGLPGRKGIGIGHNPKSYGNKVDDINRSQLKRWIPKDYQVYLDFLATKGSK